VTIALTPLSFRHLEVRNRLFRSSLSGRYDNYDGSGTEVRIRSDLRYARGGVGAIISSNAPVHPRGLILPGYAAIDRDDRIPFWRELIRRVHEHDCRYIVQLAFSGRQRDIGGIEHATGLSSTDEAEPLHGFPCERMTEAQIGEIVRAFGDAARRAREAGADGVEVHGCNGYLITQFLSSEINDRRDGYGGPLENRARLAIEVVGAIRAAVGDDYHVQFKISAVEHQREVLPWLGRGNTLAESIAVCRWLEQAGVDAFHVSSGGAFPHPRNPAGAAAVEELARTYDTMISSGRHAFRNYLLFRCRPTNRIMRWWWERPSRGGVEGINLADARAVRQAVSVPVICAGGFQTQSVISGAIDRGDCDAVSIARPLLANPHLPILFAEGHDRAPRPCTYCNRCLVMFVEHPLACYEPDRYSSREAMLAEAMEVFAPTPVPEHAG
jgi:2,4-dienoyl-CoA reductase-like NADH-dependent reductase (Old Yellow Enzyme family)